MGFLLFSTKKTEKSEFTRDTILVADADGSAGGLSGSPLERRPLEIFRQRAIKARHHLDPATNDLVFTRRLHTVRSVSRGHSSVSSHFQPAFETFLLHLSKTAALGAFIKRLQGRQLMRDSQPFVPLRIILTLYA